MVGGLGSSHEAAEERAMEYGYVGEELQLMARLRGWRGVLRLYWHPQHEAATKAAIKYLDRSRLASRKGGN